ncbi:hypothetical protein HO133_007517 [Letharia lupina]|uniref:NAD(P)-binding protein n=1 Tax=Letharia lupina TaxID=560253 RepID=A0A8H6FJ09_9LECA|nr:uncharacterized protein HO133_007517 [Letharia lupina]KAF6229401.1 hypothetical protein HO133_007517 [Letharia lupina]
MAHLITGNKFEPNKDIPDLSGKVYIVTGGTAGIGFGITAHLLQHNASKILLLSQKEEHADEAIEELKKYGDASKVHWVQCDLKDLKKTDEVAKKLTSEKQIDALICNAGQGVGKYNETVDGIDSHFQVNHLSQMLLALTLLPNLQSTPNSRLVLQSSDLHRSPLSSTKFATLDEINTDLGPNSLYSRTKLAQILFVRALVRRMLNNEPGFQSPKYNGPWINATHPGGVATDQLGQAVDAYGTMGKIGVKAIKPIMKDPVDEGCRPALFAATSEDITKEGIQGQYIVPDRKVTEPSKQARDEELGENLWRLSEQILQEKLGSIPYKQDL